MKSISLEGVAVIRTLEIGPHQFGRFLETTKDGHDLYLRLDSGNCLAT